MMILVSGIVLVDLTITHDVTHESATMQGFTHSSKTTGIKYNQNFQQMKRTDLNQLSRIWLELISNLEKKKIESELIWSPVFQL